MLQRLGLLLGMLILAGCGENPLPVVQPTSTPVALVAVGTATPSPFVTAPPQTNAAAPTATSDARLLPTFVSGGDVIHNALIPANTTTADLIALARAIHEHFPNDIYYFWDDTSQFDAFVAAETHRDNPAYPMPEAWLEVHLRGIMRRMASRPGGQWELNAGNGDFLADLD